MLHDPLQKSYKRHQPHIHERQYRLLTTQASLVPWTLERRIESGVALYDNRSFPWVAGLQMRAACILLLSAS